MPQSCKIVIDLAPGSGTMGCTIYRVKFFKTSLTIDFENVFCISGYVNVKTLHRL